MSKQAFIQKQILKKPNRLCAFTIMELMVVSILSVITVVAAFNAIRMLQKQFHNYDKETTKALHYNDLSVLLKEDSFHAFRITRQNQTLSFHYETYSIDYEVERDFIVRTLNREIFHTDTFFLTNNNLQTYFNGREKEEGLVSEINIDILYDEEPYSISMSKELDAKSLMENNYGN